MKKVLIATAIGITTLLTSTLLTSSPASAAWCFSLGTTCPSEYSNHVICNEHWRASEAYKNQGCNLNKVNYDRTVNGVWYCYHDGPGSRGRLPTRGSHSSEHARLTHSAPRIMVSLLNGTRCARRVPRGGGSFSAGV